MDFNKMKIKAHYSRGQDINENESFRFNGVRQFPKEQRKIFYEKFYSMDMAKRAHLDFQIEMMIEELNQLAQEEIDMQILKEIKGEE